MTAMMPELPDVDPTELRMKTSFGATGMLANIGRQTKAAQRRNVAMDQMLAQLSRMGSMAGPSVGPMGIRDSGPSRGRGGGKIKAPGNKKLAALMHAIGQQESGGRYHITNPIGYKGKYQIAPGNIEGKGGWDVEALGRNVTYQQYARSPRIQERIARHKMKQYIRQYGLRGAAQAWYGGPGAVGNNNISGGSGYPSTGGYADSIMGMVRRYLRRHR